MMAIMATVSRGVGTSDEEIVRRAVEDEGELPEFVDGYEVEAGFDYTGDPSVTVTFYVKHGTPADVETTGRLFRKLADSVQNKSQLLGVSRFPFVTFGERRS